MKIGVLVAMDNELALVRGLFEGKEGCVVRNCGIGKVNAGISAYKMITEDKVDVIINTGCAGGVDPIVNIGDVVIGSSCAYHDVWCGFGGCEKGQMQGLPATFPASEELLRKACVVFAADPKVHIGMIATGDRFIETAEEDAAVKAVQPHALACDMEATAIAQVCWLSGVDFLSFKVISDVHTAGADHTMQDYNDFWSRLAEKSFETLRSITEILD